MVWGNIRVNAPSVKQSVLWSSLSSSTQNHQISTDDLSDWTSAQRHEDVRIGKKVTNFGFKTLVKGHKCYKSCFCSATPILNTTRYAIISCALLFSTVLVLALCRYLSSSHKTYKHWLCCVQAVHCWWRKSCMHSMTLCSIELCSVQYNHNIMTY